MQRLLYVHNADFTHKGANKMQVVAMCQAFAKQKRVMLWGFGSSLKEYFITTKFSYSFSKILALRPYAVKSIYLALKYVLKKPTKYVYTRDLLFYYFVKTMCPKTKILYELHEINKAFFWRHLFKASLKKMKQIVVISKGLEDLLIKRGVHKSRIVLAEDAVNLERFNIPITTKKAKQELGFSQKRPAIAYIGALYPDRDLQSLMKVAKQIPSADFYIYGIPTAFSKSLKGKVKNFHIKGFTNSPEKVQKASDILFAAYTKRVRIINYMSPLKIFEYMAAKRPIVVSDFPRIRDVVDEKEVFFYESENPKSLLNAIKNALKEKNVAAKKATAAFNKVKKNTWDKRAELIIKAFHKL